MMKSGETATDQPFDDGMFAHMGKALIRLRERVGLSQSSLARKAGCGKSQLSKYEKGRELPKLESLERLLGALGVSYIVFFWTLHLIGKKGSSPALSREELGDLFGRVSRELFSLYGQVANALPDEQDRGYNRTTTDNRARNA
jgi:transcriptional regulator with XRE-family HTH domain